jgi:hypothetical protein
MTGALLRSTVRGARSGGSGRESRLLPATGDLGGNGGRFEGRGMTLATAIASRVLVLAFAFVTVRESVYQFLVRNLMPFEGTPIMSGH